MVSSLSAIVVRTLLFALILQCLLSFIVFALSEGLSRRNIYYLFIQILLDKASRLSYTMHIGTRQGLTFVRRAVRAGQPGNRAVRERYTSMVTHRQVQKVNDFMFIIVPGSCPDAERVTCDSCEHSTVTFKVRNASRKSPVEIGYVSCSYSSRTGKSLTFP